ncbi:MAG: class I SAM-dependent methyltransferase [Gammaproteobacteria bacterium]
MSIYENHILPHVIHFLCSTEPAQKQRQKVIPQAEGRVLEVGMGSGLNLPFYNRDKVEFIWGLEPSEGMRRKAQKNLRAADIHVDWLDLPGEEIPLDDNSADTVVLVYTLCTIPDWARALEQMRRVLKPGGKLIFCEHGLAPDPSPRKWQDRLNPVWKKIAGGCHLNRQIPVLLEQGGFRIKDMEADYVEEMPRFAGYTYRGSAGKA